MRLTCPTFCLCIFDADTFETKFCHDATKEWCRIFQVAQHFQKRPIVESKSRKMLNLLNRRHLFDHLIITRAQRSHDWILLTGSFDARNYLCTLLPFCHNLRNHFYWVLKITTHHDCAITRSLKHAIIRTIKLSKILRIEDSLYFRITFADFTKQRTCVIF